VELRQPAGYWELTYVWTTFQTVFEYSSINLWTD
jgi:hypothetical protein